MGENIIGGGEQSTLGLYAVVGRDSGAAAVAGHGKIILEQGWWLSPVTCSLLLPLLLFPCPLPVSVNVGGHSQCPTYPTQNKSNLC